MSQSYLSGLERGHFNTPSFEVSVKIANALNIDPGILLREAIKLTVPPEFRKYIFKSPKTNEMTKKEKFLELVKIGVHAEHIKKGVNRDKAIEVLNSAMKIREGNIPDDIKVAVKEFLDAHYSEKLIPFHKWTNIP